MYRVGSKNLDNSLDGNVIETQAITHSSMAAGSGKTVTVYYLYVETKFRPEEFLKLQ